MIIYQIIFKIIFRLKLLFFYINNMSNLLLQNNIRKRFAGRNKKESEYNYKLYVLSNRFKEGKEKKYYNTLLKASLNCNKIKNLPNIYDNEDNLVKFDI